MKCRYYLNWKDRYEILTKSVNVVTLDPILLFTYCVTLRCHVVPHVVGP